MAVKIVTDSLSDITSDMAGELGITVVPLHVLFGTDSYRDGVDLKPEDFYKKLGLSALTRKSDYHELAKLVPKESIAAEVKQVLDAICTVAGKARPVE